VKTLLVTPKARQDLDAIWSHTVSEWGSQQAERYLRQLWCALEDEASGFSRAQDASFIRDGYFKIICGLHVIFFQSSADAILVVRVLHQRMDVSRHLIE